MRYDEYVEWLAKQGRKPLPPEHPIYSEGPSITLSSRTPGQLDPKDTDSTSSDSTSEPGSDGTAPSDEESSSP